MKRAGVLVIVLFMLLCGTGQALASIPGYEGGIQNEYEYKEMLFITGKPVLLTGKVTVRARTGSRRGVTTTRCTYDYELENTEEEVELDRSYTLETTLDFSVDGQVIEQTLIDGKPKETITVKDDTYKLTDYIFSKSRVIHQKPVCNFFSANWTAKKIYTVNRDEGTVIVESSGEEVGYENYWSSTRTQTVKQNYRVARAVAGEDETVDVEWEGDVEYRASSSSVRNLSYVDNQPSQISFRGGYLESRKETQLIEYNYDLPRFDDEDIPYEHKREIDDYRLSLETSPVNRRLHIPELKDISGHWAEDDIKQLYSLGVFGNTSSYFGANLPILRAEFARAIAEATKLAQLETVESGQEETGEEVFEFYDVNQANPNKDYIYQVARKGIIKGTAPGQFSPDGRLTRAQAITIMIRSLGFENLAPTPGYHTGFSDDGDIPYWARDAMYVAREIGLIKGDSFGNALPNEVMSRAEAAAFLNRFVEYLRRDIVKDYRDRILYY